MAAQVKKSKLADKLGDAGRKAHEANKNNEVKLGFGGRLPAGIENGIAQVVDLHYGEFDRGDNKGKPFFMAAAVVKSPEFVMVGEYEESGATVGNVVVVSGGTRTKIAGMRTQIGPFPICAVTNKKTKEVTSLEDNYEKHLNELRKLLGGSTANLKLEMLEDVCASLVKAGVYTKFRTYVGKVQTEGEYKGKDPMRGENWSGVCPAPDARRANGQADDGVTDNSGGYSVDSDASGAEDGSNGQSDAVEVDLDALGEAAKEYDGDEPTPAAVDAQTKLLEIALEAGITKDDFENENSWEEAVASIRAAQSGEGDGSTPDETPTKDWVPKKGDCCVYVPIDPKTKKPKSRSVEVEVVSVNTKKKTVVLKNLVDGKSQYDDVHFDKLVKE